MQSTKASSIVARPQIEEVSEINVNLIFTSTKAQNAFIQMLSLEFLDQYKCESSDRQINITRMKSVRGDPSLLQSLKKNFGWDDNKGANGVHLSITD